MWLLLLLRNQISNVCDGDVREVILDVREVILDVREVSTVLVR